MSKVLDRRRGVYLPLLTPPRALREVLETVPRRLEVRATETTLVLRAVLGGGRGAVATYSVQGPIQGRVTFSDETRIEQPAPVDPGELASLWSRTRWVSSLVLRSDDQSGYAPTVEERALADLFVSLERGEKQLRGVSPTIAALDRRDWDAFFSRADAFSKPPWMIPFVRAFEGHGGRIRAHGRDEEPLDGHLATFRGLGRRELNLLEPALADLKKGVENLPKSQRAHHYVMVAETAHLLGDDDEARRLLAWSLPLSADDDAFARAARQLLHLGGYGDAERALAAWCENRECRGEIWLLRARLAIWCGRTSDARRFVARADQRSTDAILVRAICDALDGRDDDALAELETIAHLELREAFAWSAEILKRRGESARAVEHLEVACLTTQNAVHTLLRCVVYDEMQKSGRAQLAAQEGIVDPDSQTIEAAARALRTFQGNRGSAPSRTPTVDPVPSADSLAPVPIPPGDMLHMSRNASADLLRDLRTKPASEIHAGFAALQEEYPDSAHPWCYWGELLLWEGRYDEAHAAFSATPAARVARWGYVGRAAVEIHRGAFDAALAEFDGMNARYDPVRGATTHVFLGELHRLRGDYEAALHELDIAIGAKEARVGARVNRILCLAHTGESELAQARLEATSNRWPNVFWHAARDVGVPWSDRATATVEVCESALRLMRGNRSSHLHTFFDADGELRFTVDAKFWVAHFERCLTHLRLGVLEAILGRIS